MAVGSVNPVPLMVQKYGGTSVGDPDRIKAVADHIARTARAGNSVVVTVSAMGKTTDDLLRLANDVAADPGGRELDMLLTAGGGGPPPPPAGGLIQPRRAARRLTRPPPRPRPPPPPAQA